MKEEKLIRNLTEGKGNPFHVPNGYFDSFTDRMMKQLPAQPVKEMSRLWRYAAAVVVVAGLSTTYLLTHNNASSDSNYELYANDYNEQALDYALVGNQDIETFLTEAY